MGPLWHTLDVSFRLSPGVRIHVILLLVVSLPPRGPSCCYLTVYVSRLSGILRLLDRALQPPRDRFAKEDLQQQQQQQFAGPTASGVADL